MARFATRHDFAMSNSPGRNRNRVDSLPLALLFAASFFAPASGRSSQDDRSAGFNVRKARCGLAASYSNSDHSRRGRGLRRQRQPCSPSGQGSIFTKENVVLTYDRPGEQTEFYMLAVGRFSQYFDVTGENETEKRHHVAYA